MAQQDGSATEERWAPTAGRVAAGAGIALGITLVTGGTAHATDYTVTNLDPSGPGSLRDAIETANSDATADRVLFQSGLSGTIDLNPSTGPSTGSLQVTEPLDIVGPGADQVTVSGDAQSRVFYIHPNTFGDDVSISGLKIIQGNIKYCQYDCQYGPPPFGTTQYSGGNIYSDGADLTITNSVIRSGGAVNAGGVWENEGTLTMRDSTVANNVAIVSGGGIGIAGNPTEYSPVVNSGNADQQPTQPSVISGSTIHNNSAGSKYGFFTQGGGTAARADGAGADTEAADRPNAGGGIAATSALTVENSTLNHNVDTGRGGGIAFAPSVFYNPEAGAGQLRVESTTISGNTAGSGGGVYWYTRRNVGNDSPEPPNPVIENSIVANNQADSQQHSPDIGGVQIQDTIEAPAANSDQTRADVTFDAAFSLLRDTSGVTVNETVPGSNITGQDPLLAALDANRGPTHTTALLPGSPAIDHGRTPAGETTDQRGQTRPFDLPQIGNSAAPGADGADMGAFEVQGAVPTGTCQGKPATISGTENRDVLTGTAGNDVIVGFGGNDIIKALRGDDLVCAGDGQDQVTGGLGDDELHGEGGKDRMTGQAGDDTVLDTAGDDQLNGGVGDDIVKGGAGQDRILGSKGNDRLFGQAAPDVLLGAKGNDFLRGGPGNDRLSGGTGVNNVQQ